MGLNLSILIYQKLHLYICTYISEMLPSFDFSSKFNLIILGAEGFCEFDDALEGADDSCEVDKALEFPIDFCELDEALECADNSCELDEALECADETEFADDSFDLDKAVECADDSSELDGKKMNVLNTYVLFFPVRFFVLPLLFNYLNNFINLIS